jgi:sortase family protein
MRRWLPAAAVIGSAGLALSVYGISTPPHVHPPISVAPGSPRAEKSLSPTHRALSGSTSSSASTTVPRPVRRERPRALVHKVASKEQEPRSAPARLALPSLGISSRLGPARGLNPDGTLNDAPLSGPTWSLPWWYDQGPSPGQSGSAVILGHVDSALGEGGLGVFFRLGDVLAGQRIDVTLANHITTHWTVTSVRLYADALFPDALVYARTGPPALRLVTCGGAFDWSTHEYESSLVVTAQLVNP